MLAVPNWPQENAQLQAALVTPTPPNATLLKVEAGTIALTGTIVAAEATDEVQLGPTCQAGYCDTATTSCDTENPAGEFRGNNCRQSSPPYGGCEDGGGSWLIQGSANAGCHCYVWILVAVDDVAGAAT